VTNVSAGLDHPGLLPAGSGVLQYQKGLQDSQWWTPERLLERQLRALGRVVAHAGRTVPFHGSRLAAAGLEPERPIDLARWRRLPPLSRRDVQRAGADLHSTAIPPEHGKVLKNKTSGSTGTPVVVRGTTFDAVLGKALILRHCLWHPYDFSAKMVSIRRVHGQMYDYPSGLHLTRWGDSATFPFATGPSAILSIGASIAQQAEWLVREDPDYLLTFPSNLRFLAAHCRERGIALPHLEHVTTFGEVLSAETREECRRAWDLSVIDAYSAQEVGIIALQCPTHAGYHVQAETIFVEVVDQRDEPCRPGEVGRVLVTPLYNYAMPLLRYEIGDWAEVGRACPCGRGLPVVNRILGRERNALLVAPNGERYWPAFGTRKLPDLAPIIQHQFVQTSLERVEARLVTARPLTRREERSLRAYILTNMPYRFELAFTYLDEIPRNAAGKFEDFVCEVTA
jgi:phenylacetate-coenzyme A ligase PaaK-like adenylate-forming protein